MRDAAAQFFGPVAMIPLAASLIIGAAAFVVMRLYMRAVFRESRRPRHIRNAVARRRSYDLRGSSRLLHSTSRPTRPLNARAHSPNAH